MITALKYHRTTFGALLNNMDIPQDTKDQVLEVFLESLRAAMVRRHEELREELRGKERLIC